MSFPPALRPRTEEYIERGRTDRKTKSRSFAYVNKQAKRTEEQKETKEKEDTRVRKRNDNN